MHVSASKRFFDSEMLITNFRDCEWPSDKRFDLLNRVIPDIAHIISYEIPNLFSVFVRTILLFVYMVTIDRWVPLGVGFISLVAMLLIWYHSNK